MTAPVSTGTGAVVLKIRIFQERRLFMVKSKTMTTESTIATTEQVTYDSDMMSAELDKIQLNKSQTIKGILRLVICSAIGKRMIDMDFDHMDKINHLASESFDGQIESHTMLFYGICGDCLRKS